MTDSRTRAGEVPAVLDLTSAPTDTSAFARLRLRGQAFLPSLIALALLFGMLIYAEIAYGRVFHAGTMSDLLVGAAPC